MSKSSLQAAVLCRDIHGDLVRLIYPVTWGGADGTRTWRVMLIDSPVGEDGEFLTWRLVSDSSPIEKEL